MLDIGSETEWLADPCALCFPPLYCGAVSATGIESQNIVGYQTKAVGKNLSQQVCTFDQIGVEGGALDIQKLIPVDAEGEYIGDGAVHIQFISPLGVMQTAYGYYGDDEYDDGMKAGWVDEDNDELVDITLSAGEGFMVTAGQAGYLRFPEL